MPPRRHDRVGSAATDASRLESLIATGLVDPSDVVEGRLVLRDLSRRNADLLVLRGDRPAHFVKWPLTEADVPALHRESAVLDALSEAGCGDLVPARRHVAPDAGLLAVEGFPASEDLRMHHLRRVGFPVDVAASVGSAIGLLHGRAAGTTTSGVEREPPWALSLHRPALVDLEVLTPASIDLMTALQSDTDTCRALDALRRGWPADGLVHGDLKWDNVLLTGQSAADVRIVDWEHARWGDLLWDPGAVVAGYLSFWIFSIDARDAPPEALLTRAGVPLEELAAAVAAFWGAYRAARTVPAGATARTAALAGARLIATAYEATQGGSQLTAHIVLHLQLGANLLRHPTAATAVGLVP